MLQLLLGGMLLVSSKAAGATETLGCEDTEVECSHLVTECLSVLQCNVYNSSAYYNAQSSYDAHHGEHWIAFSFLSGIALIGAFFEIFFEKISEAVDKNAHHIGHHVLVLQKNKLDSVLWDSFQNEVTILGCVSFAVWLLDICRFYRFIADLEIVEIEELDLQHLAHQVHYSMFAAMCMHILFCWIFSMFVQTRMKTIVKFVLEPEQNCVARPTLQKILENAEETMNEYKVTSGLDVDIDLPHYLHLKLIDAVSEMLAFDTLAWIMTSSAAAGFAILAHNLGEWGAYIVFFGSIAILLIYLGWIEYQIYRYMKPYPLPAGFAPEGVTPERVRNSAAQAFSFYVCYYTGFALVSSLTQGSFGWLIIMDVGTFLLFIVGYPFLLSRWFHIVLALPPYFDTDCLKILKLSCEDEFANSLSSRRRPRDDEEGPVDPAARKEEQYMIHDH